MFLQARPCSRTGFFLFRNGRKWRRSRKSFAGVFENRNEPGIVSKGEGKCAGWVIESGRNESISRGEGGMRGFFRVLLLLLPAGWIFAQVSDGKEAGSPNPGRLPRKSAPLVFPTGGSVYRMLKPENFDRCRREVLTLLSGKDEMPSPGVQTSFPVWGSLYAGLVDSGMKKVNGSADSSLYVFGLICAGQLSRAELRGMEFLKKEPENFGLLVLLGALAERNGELFPCLERAIAENPTKTIEILNTLSHLRLISLTRKEEFLDRYLHQLFLHRAEIQRKSLAEWTVFRLQQIIRLQRKRRGGLGKQDSQMATFSEILSRVARKSPSVRGQTIQIQTFRNGTLVQDSTQPEEIERNSKVWEGRGLRQEN